MKLNRLAALFVLALCRVALASDPGTDNAGNAAYSSGWTNGSKGSAVGHAFGEWRILVSPDGTKDAEFKLEDSKSLASPGADVNSDGKAFELRGKKAGAANAEADAYRDFAGGGLSVGQSFSIDLAVNWRNGFKGIDIRSGTDAKNDRKTIFNFNVGSDDYVVNNAATGNGSVGSDYKDKTKFHLQLTQTTTMGGTWKLTREGTDKPKAGTYTGIATGFKIYCSGTDGGKEDSLFFNNLVIANER